jgi:hypothetical protein
MAEFDDLSAALGVVRGNFSPIGSAVADERRAGQLCNALAKSIMTELLPIARAVQGSDWDYEVAILRGFPTVLGLRDEYSEFANL